MARKFYRSSEGDTLDAIAYRFYGKTSGITERLLLLNRGLEKYIVLPRLTHVLLLNDDELPEVKPVKEVINLWD
ncbi:hypothetical protein A6A19_00955 [Actinobacillus delphinicola]|uniref:tail protein X n=1 Tax=Actinobacillus delphinicola TaxID=51161 RepID=UPI0024436873|nr:tail protein X [Actinobacillus delphinicola]MDG6896598.1 hypothetical protein [Actinobacillus delphinicola]